MNPFSIIGYMKTLLKLFIPLMAIALTSCGGTPTVSESGTSLFANRKMTSTSISYSCEKDNRNATYTFQVKKNHADEITFNATVEYGFFT